MENIFDPTYRQDYLNGYSNGLNPYIDYDEVKYNDAFHFGFVSGRLDYENRNGYIIDGIPKRIVTKKVLEDFLLAGLLGLPPDTDGYTNFQLNVLAKWYQSGTEKYDPNQSMYLFAILEKNGIQVEETYYM
jgi:adenylate kinase family enzyme